MVKKPFIRHLLLLLVILLAFSSFSMGAFARGKTTNTGTTSTTPQPLAELFGNINLKSSQSTKVIVELTEESIVEAKHKGKSQSKANLAKERKKVKDAVQKAAKSSKINREYDYVFSGFSVELAANEIPALLAVPGVKAVYPEVTYTVTTEKGELISPEAYGPQMFASIPHIGVDQAWDAGFTGKGITVAVIDTGADYTHPDLAHAFGEYKGYDFVDNDEDPQETPKGDPRGEETAHGTHVSGTVAANGALIKGVAPEASLLAYRVLGPGGSGTTENVIAGIERAVQDGADIMNLSLGNSLNLPDYATSIALDWAMAEGVVAVTSNGNSGPANWTVGSPGTSRDAISVGATQLPFNMYSASIFTSEGVEYPSAKVQGFPSDEELLELNGNEYEFVHVGLGAASDFEGKDVEGKIALISRGAYPFVDKATNAKNAGAVGAIIYNNIEGEFVDVPGMAVPTIKMTKADGEKMLAELDAGNNTVSFTIEFARTVDETMADFSSRGPVIETWMIKPDVSAPGVNITSTVPTHDPENPHGYAAYQGTSMASPHVAGAAALLLEANPDWGVDDVKAALMNTAVELYDANGNVYPHNTQGAGSIRPLDAINANTLATPGSHSFGVFYKDKGKQAEKQHFTIKNLSSERKTYSFEASFEASFEGSPNGLKVSTSNNLKVNPGQSQQVTLNVQVDAGNLEPGYYEGTIVVSDGTTTFDVPTILFVKDPDYPRVEYVDVIFDSNGITEVGGYFPGGAETVDFFVYLSNADGAPVAYLGDIAVYENVPSGYQGFEWDGTITLASNGEKFELPKGYYYNVYAYATYKGVTTLGGVNFKFE